MAKSYQTSNGVKYSFKHNFRKWEFEFPKGSLLIPAGGAENAHRMAALIDKSVVRGGTLDNLTKANLYRMA